MIETHFQNYIPAKSLKSDELLETSQKFFDFMKTRRTIRSFSKKTVQQEVIENCLKAAGTAPSGANKQPWFFAVIKSDEVKNKIRVAAEKEEHLFYNKRASKTWLDDLKAFKTNEKKPYLEVAPYLIAVFYKTSEETNGNPSRSYYAKESTGLATGMLITALHNCGLATLTHTPSPMNFLNEVLDISASNYKPFLLLVTGYPDESAQVPVLCKKSLDQISQFY